MVYNPFGAERPFELVFFNTDNSQDNQTNPRRLRIPPRYSKGFASIRMDPEVTFGRLNCKDPLIVDPTQAFLTVRFWGGGQFEDILLLLRTQTLIAHACSTSQDTYIPWDELARDVTIARLPPDSPFLVQGLHVITRKTYTSTDLGTKGLPIRAFDFSLRGSSVLRGGSIETLRADWYEGGQGFLLHEYFGGTPDWLGNGTFFDLVSRFCRCEKIWYDDPTQGLVPRLGPRDTRLAADLKSLVPLDSVFSELWRGLSS